MTQLNKDEEKRARTLSLLKDNLEFFGSTCLKIRDKMGMNVPFVLNRAQQYVHKRLENQVKRIGKVRALILKGRQQGMSTYTAARFYHKSIMNCGTTSFILSHQAKTTDPLFSMVKRFQEYLPVEIKPILDSCNKNQLKFAGLSSEYTVGTAGNEDLGRGFTIRLLHGSEAAWYDKTDELETGLFQAVPELPGTEIILESTANGMNNMFYNKCMSALKGEGEYELIFVPWFWQLEYRTKAPLSFSLSSDEMTLKNIYNLDNDQILWRRNKIISLKDEWKFMQEYPMNPKEAFIVSGESFYSKVKLLEARKSNIKSYGFPVIAGVDCARTNDRNVILLRQGRALIHKETYTFNEGENISDIMANNISNVIEKFNVDKVFIDYGSGYGIVDILRGNRYHSIVTPIYFGSAAIEKDRFINKRAEMHFLARDWLEDGEVNVFDDDDFFVDLLAIPNYKEGVTNNKVSIVSKRDIRAKSGFSPDLNDAFVLTFAMPVHNKNTIFNGDHIRPTKKRRMRIKNNFNPNTDLDVFHKDKQLI